MSSEGHHIITQHAEKNYKQNLIAKRKDNCLQNKKSILQDIHEKMKSLHPLDLQLKVAFFTTFASIHHLRPKTSKN